MIRKLISAVLVMSIILSFMNISIISVSAAPDISIGDYIQMGTYYGEPILWRCVDIDENGPLILSDKIICMKAFDAKGTDTKGSHGRGYSGGVRRKQYGSNYWGDSNIRCWLNSEQSAGNVYWACGNPPSEENVHNGFNAYNNEAGFLTNFSYGEKQIIKSVTQKTLIDPYEYSQSPNSNYHRYNTSISSVLQNYSTALDEYTTDKIFLLDIKQVVAVYNNSSTLGKHYYIGTPTEKCVSYSEMEASDFRTGDNWLYSLRSPAYDTYSITTNYFSSAIRHIGKEGTVNWNMASNDHSAGVRPAFYLVDNANFTYGDGSEDNPYRISGINTNSNSDMKSYVQEAGISYGDYYYNIFTQYATIAKGNDTEMLFCPNVITGGESHSNLKMYLTQGADKMLEVDTWAKTPIKPGEFFEADKKIYLLLQNTATGQSASKLTKLKVVSENIKNDVIWEQEDNTDEKISFKLGNMMSFNIPDTVPVFGGAEVEMDLDFIPISVEYAHPDKLNIVFGAEIASQKGEKDRVWGDVKYFKDFSFENYKRDFKKAISRSNRSIKQLRNDYKMTNKVPLKSFKNISGNVDVAGYAEMKYINGQWRFVEGMLGLDAEIGYKYQGNNVIYFIPITYSIGGSVGAGIDGVMKNLNTDTFTPQFEGYLNGRISATIGGGIGMSVAKLVYADGTGTLNVRKSLNDEYLKSWVDAHADFVVCEVGSFTFLRKTFAQGEWLIYETGNPNGIIPHSTMSLMSINDAYSNYDKDTVYEVTPRNKEKTTWLGDLAPVSLFAAEYTGQDTKLLSENIYYSAEPKIDIINGKKVMVWLADNKDRDIYNKTMLVYSIYDESNDTWSAPLPVSDDGTSDTYPDFNNGYAVWQNNNSVMDENTTISEYAKDCDICIAKFNGTGFDETIKVTDNQIMDSMPKVFADESGVNVTWVTNTENDILGTTGKNSIYFKKLGEAEQIIKDNLNAITGLSLGNINNEVSIAYSFDEDNDLATIDDRDIYVYSNGQTINLNNDNVINSNPVFSGNKLYWYTNNNIEYTSDLSTVNKMFESTGISTDQFNVHTNNSGKSAAFWVESDETATEVYVSLFENNEWSNPIKLTDLDAKIKSPYGILDETGNIAVSFTDIVIDGENIFANLYVLDAVPSYDISVANVEFNENNLVENSDFPISVDIINNGEKDINEYKITVSDKYGVNNTYTFNDKLKAGTAVTQTIQYSVPTTMSKQTISINVSITDGEEFDDSNNNYDLILGNERISLSKIELHETGERYQIVSKVTNEGFTDASDITINLRKDSVDGTIIGTRYISSLSSQGSNEIIFDEPITGMEYEDGIKKLYVTVECHDSVEDSKYVLLQELQADKEFEQMIVSVNYNSDTKILNSNAIVTNNTDAKQDFVMIFAVYDGDRLIGIDCSDGSVLPYNETSVDGFVSLSDYKTQYTVCSFLWKDLETLIPLCEKDEYMD